MLPREFRLPDGPILGVRAKFPGCPTTVVTAPLELMLRTLTLSQTYTVLFESQEMPYRALKVGLAPVAVDPEAKIVPVVIPAAKSCVEILDEALKLV